MAAAATISVRDLQDKAAAAATLLKIMAHDRRLIVLCELAGSGERSVTELEQVSGLSQSALSQHLAKMRQHGIVKTRRAAQTIYYSLASREAKVLIEVLCRLYVPHVDSLPEAEPEGAAAG